ncbi:MAG: hypothetical protein QOE99_408 [Actinomycetota bacterium]|nr:hypothetical protein [Actinomycetota bacterium]
MNRSTSLGKFAPLAAIAAVQLLVILLVPSVGRTSGAGFDTAAGLPAPGAPGTAAAGAPGAVGTVPGAAAVPGAATGGAPAAGTTGAVTGGTTGAGGAPGTAAAAGTSGQTAAVAGDTKHCIGGRQFDPAIDYYAPPCVQGVPGAAFANNGGATWQGVSKDTIEIVQYVPDYGAAVNTILKAQGLFYDANQAAVLDAAFARFINAKYQLYGRKVHVDTFQGTCATVPPDLKCLIPEMDTMVDKYHPYAVLFSTTVCSACFAELARKKVITSGGSGFSDEFHNANAPYNYDVSMSSTRMSQQFAEFWCKQMTSKGNTGRTAIFAGTQNPAQNFRTKPRVLGVVSTNDPDNENTVKKVLYPALKKGCGEVVGTHEYFYAQDISRAQQQSQAGTAAMNDSNPATSVVCLCDPVAPQFSYSAAAQNNYWPESLVATNQAMDFDSSGQTYVDDNGNPTLACPNPRQGCPFDNGIGLGAANPQVAPAQMAGVKIFNMYSGGAALPVQPPTADIFWNNFNLFASLIENTGPFLTPARMQQAAPALGARGGGSTGQALLRFSKGNYSWTQDTRVLYFNKHQASPYNGKNGKYISIEGNRFELGQFPTLKEPPAPAPEDRK